MHGFTNFNFLVQKDFADWPGPAVTAATPTVPDNRAKASAAKTALTYNLKSQNNCFIIIKFYKRYI